MHINNNDNKQIYKQTKKQKNGVDKTVIEWVQSGSKSNHQELTQPTQKWTGSARNPIQHRLRKTQTPQTKMTSLWGKMHQHGAAMAELRWKHAHSCAPTWRCGGFSVGIAHRAVQVNKMGEGGHVIDSHGKRCGVIKSNKKKERVASPTSSAFRCQRGSRTRGK